MVTAVIAPPAPMSSHAHTMTHITISAIAPRRAQALNASVASWAGANAPHSGHRHRSSCVTGSRRTACPRRLYAQRAQ